MCSNQKQTLYNYTRMGMTRKEYNLLYGKYISGKCTDEELKLIETYKDSFELRNSQWDIEIMGEPDSVKQNILTRLDSSIRKHNRFTLIRSLKWWAAASIILIALSSALFMKYYEHQEIVHQPEPSRFKNDIKPGNNVAILTLDDGSTINLNNAKNGILARQSNTKIEKSSDGQLYYIAGEQMPGAEIRYNTIETPKGGQFQVILPDGSRVWLNAGSSLRFPTAFIGIERKVELRGEAYFEVSENVHMPFIVHTDDSDIKVLGTHFNVMAYDDEKNTNTTLLEGSVQVLKGSDKLLIKPGESAVVNKSTGSINVTLTDTEQAVAWKNGYFIFDHESIESIMRKVSRWYNVEVSYSGNMSNKDFAGTISRDKNVSELLEMLELTGAVKFKIEGRRITVMP